MATAEHPKGPTASTFLGMIVLCFLYHLVTLVASLYGVLPHYPGAPLVEPGKVIGAALGGSGVGISVTIFICARSYAPHSQSMHIRLLLDLNVAATIYAWTAYVGDYQMFPVMFALGVVQLVWFSCLGLRSQEEEHELIAET